MINSLLLNINPANAVSNIANYSLLGSMFLLLLWFVIYNIRGSTKEKKDLLEWMNKERIYKDKESNEADKKFIEYLQNNNAKLINIIEKNTQTTEKNNVLMTELIVYFKSKKNE